jgi:alpha-N-arabinofuranosidase
LIKKLASRVEMMDNMRVCIVAIMLSAGGLLPGSASDSISADGQATSLTIDVQEQGAVISPLLFGHNLEHTRRAVWQGLSAEMIANRKFAAVDGGLPKRWSTMEGGRVAVDNQVTYAGKHAVRLENGNGDSSGIWQQHEWLAFRKNAKYAFRVWIKADTNQTLTMRIMKRGYVGQVFATSTEVRPGAWQLWSGEFASPATAPGGRLEIVSTKPGVVWIGAVSLMPSNNFHGMRRDVVDLLKTLKPGILRWPGGCFAEYYNWQDGLLPVDQRPPTGPGQWKGLLPDSDDYDNHEIGTDEYMALCRELNCASAITIRYGGGGSPEEAAAWVEYCNGDPATRWGKVRAERGHPEPYRVKYWFVGNEIWGMSLVQNKDPKACAALSRQFAGAMKRADPSIARIHCATFLLPDWHATVLKEITDSPDFPELVQDGWYLDCNADVNMASVAKAPTLTIEPPLQTLRIQLDQASQGKKRVGMVYYEWNAMWDRPGDVISGVFAAGMLNMFCREAETLRLEFTGYFQPVSEGAIKVGPLTSEIEPAGLVFALYAAHQGNRLLKTPQMPADADLDLCASLTPDGKQTYVTVVNRSTGSGRTLELSLRNFAMPGEATAKLLIPLTLEPEGKFVQREEKLPVMDGSKARLKLPPCAIARVRFGTPGLPE